MHEALTTAYAEIGKAYQTAVDVSTFTWKMFYLRCVAVFTAAGYLAIDEHQICLAVGLLMISAIMTVIVTKKQMHDNQRVIQKLLASGFLLEIRNPGFGHRFLHEIHLDDGAEEKKIPAWNKVREHLVEKYTTKKDPAGPAYTHNWVDPGDWKYFGIYPSLTAFAMIYGGVHVVFAIGVLFLK
jgi:hypothetical protein